MPIAIVVHEFDATATPVHDDDIAEVHRIAGVRIQAVRDEIFGIDTPRAAAAYDIAQADCRRADNQCTGAVVLEAVGAEADG